MNIPSGWTECPAGAFTRLAANLALKRQREIWLTGLAWAVGALLAVAGSWATAGAIDGWIAPDHLSSAGARPGSGCGSTPPPCSAPSNHGSK